MSRSHPHNPMTASEAAVKTANAAERQAAALERLASSNEQIHGILVLLTRHLAPTKVTGTPRAAFRIFDVTDGE